MSCMYAVCGAGHDRVAPPTRKVHSVSREREVLELDLQPGSWKRKLEAKLEANLKCDEKLTGIPTACIIVHSAKCLVPGLYSR